MVLPQVTVGMLPLVPFDRRQWVDHLVHQAHRPRLAGSFPQLFSSANGNVLSRAAVDPVFRSAMLSMDGIDADGMPLVLASQALSARALPERCATTDLFHDIAARAEREALSFYCLGADEQTSLRAAQAITKAYPELRLAGRHHGYFAADAEPAIVDAINAAAPDILWVGLGVPREQDFVLRHRRAFDRVGVIKTCGGLFDFLSGSRSRAPELMQRMGCEWLYRLGLEPRRLFRRYAVTNLHASWLLLTGTLSPLETGSPMSEGQFSWLDGAPLSL
ncbi:exopolysaccharide biosynthesis WecB/TagA/CpsF family protein [Rhodoligotrophos appendicifer]|uniref:WecB/TagA/CpsF family glycosyltransferase n=1 Tax=Rhodoligotrophos appendicifer TaxID=987056 RepID=UPI00118598FC|nr:WecB/TagA/CpsF family glycosyltransferase [Rhodoligotrophos appendicifer]